MLLQGTEKTAANTVMPLYRPMTQLHLEYWAQFWSLYLKRDMAEVGEVQKRAIKMIKGLEYHP